MSQTKNDFFISFSTKDKERVQQIVSLMEQQGATCWFQLRDSKQDFSEAIAQAIENSNALIVFLSHNSAKSKFVKNEINFASEQNLKICPVIIDGDIKDKEYSPIKILIGTYNMLNITDEACNTDEKLVAKIFNQLDFVSSVKKTRKVFTNKHDMFSAISPTSPFLQTKHKSFIGPNEFQGNLNLVNVTIPNGITSIHYKAFANCTNLKCIYIPNSVTNIGVCAFKGCSKLTSVTIGNSVMEISASAFSDCSILTNLTIPDSVTSIEERAFEYCRGLTSITIPDSITSIGNEAFVGCSGLTSITIPDSVTKIGEYAFAFCTNLKTIYCETKNKPEGWNDKWNINCNAEVIWGCNGNTENKA